MGFWDSFDDEMERTGSRTRLNKRESREEFESAEEDDAGDDLDDTDIEEVEDECIADSSVRDSADLYLAEGDRALQECQFDDAMDNYMEAIDRGSRKAIISLADLMIFSALYNKQGNKYWIGSDNNKDYALELGVTLYLFGSFYPECEGIADEHIQIVVDECANTEELEKMFKRVSGRFSEKIIKDPIGFVKAILSQYNPN